MALRVHACLLCLVCFVGLSCARKTPTAPESNPAWLTALIHTFETQPVANPPLSVTRYDYKGDIVYFVPARCCDVWSDLYRADGTLLCHPNGGFTGGGDSRCPDFLRERKNPHVVWQDPRTVP